MQYREYGKTGEKLSMIGFAGIIVSSETQKDADSYVAEAFDAGVNYFDVAPSYGDAQDRLGPALAGKRNDVFLSCKTGKRTRDEAEAELNNSLKVLQTDHFDLYQMHAMMTDEEVETVFSANGAMETMLRAREAGKIRYIGFSAHTEEAAIALLDRFPFDSVLFPFNWATYLKNNFGPALVEKVKGKDTALLALKAMARSLWPQDLPEEKRPYPKCWYQPIDDPQKAELALRFTLSLPISAAVTPGDIRLFRMAIKAAANFSPVSDAEIAALRQWDPDLQPIFPH